MNILQEIKLLLWLKKLGGNMGSNIWDKLDGTKTITGLLMIIAYYALPHWDVQVPNVVLDLGIGWAGVGLAHKLDKTTGLLSILLDVLTKTKNTVNKDGENK